MTSAPRRGARGAVIGARGMARSKMFVGGSEGSASNAEIRRRLWPGIASRTEAQRRVHGCCCRILVLAKGHKGSRQVPSQLIGSRVSLAEFNPVPSVHLLR